MAWLAGVLRSSTRLSSRVSWLTRISSPSGSASPSFGSGLAASMICRGSIGTAAETMKTWATWISRSLTTQPSTGVGTDLMTPWTSMTDSFVIPATNLSICLLMLSLTDMMPWIVIWLCLKTKKHCFPLALDVWSLPRIQTVFSGGGRSVNLIKVRSVIFFSDLMIPYDPYFPSETSTESIFSWFALDAAATDASPVEVCLCCSFFSAFAAFFSCFLAAFLDTLSLLKTNKRVTTDGRKSKMTTWLQVWFYKRQDVLGRHPNRCHLSLWLTLQIPSWLSL